MERAASALEDLPRAIVARDAARIARCFDPAVRFRALTPNTERSGATADDAVAIIDDWFREKRELSLQATTVDSVMGRTRASWRIACLRDGAPHVVEQVAYCDVADGRIADIAIVCSGFRPTAPAGEGATHELDAGDLGCGSGLPAEVRRHLAAIAIGERLRVVTRDAAAREDLPALARLLGQRVLTVEPSEGTTTITLERVR